MSPFVPVVATSRRGGGGRRSCTSKISTSVRALSQASAETLTLPYVISRAAAPLEKIRLARTTHRRSRAVRFSPAALRAPGVLDG